MFEKLHNSSLYQNKELSNDHLNSCRKRIRIDLYLWLKKSLCKLGIQGNFSTVVKFGRVSPKKEKKSTSNLAWTHESSRCVIESERTSAVAATIPHSPGRSDQEPMWGSQGTEGWPNLQKGLGLGRVKSNPRPSTLSGRICGLRPPRVALMIMRRSPTASPVTSAADEEAWGPPEWPGGRRWEEPVSESREHTWSSCMGMRGRQILQLLSVLIGRHLLFVLLGFQALVLPHRGKDESGTESDR